MPKGEAGLGGSEIRVLVVAPQPLYEDRGTPIAVVHVLKALSELGCHVDVLTFPVGSDVAIPRVRWHRVANPLRFRHVPVGLSYRKVILDVLLAARLWRMLKQSRYDYIHAVEESAFFATWLGSRVGVPVLYDMASSIPQHLSRRRLLGTRLAQAVLLRAERWLLSQADLVVASEGLAGYVKERVPSANIEEWRFPPAVWSGCGDDARALREVLNVPRDAKTVVYSGTFDEYQGLRALLVAAHGVVKARPGTVFIAVGGDQRGAARLQGLVEKAGLAPHFRVLPRQPRDRALAFLGLADVLVSPRAHGNNLPLKIGDYMAASKPIVATKIPAHTSVLDSTRAVLTDTDGAGLASGILTVLSDEAEAERLAVAAKAYGDSHLGWGSFRDSIADHLHRLMTQEPRNGPLARWVSRARGLWRRSPERPDRSRRP